MAAKPTPQHTINAYYVRASLALTIAAVFTLPIGGNFPIIGYVAAILALTFGFIGLTYKAARIPVTSAARLIQASSIIYATLGALMLWVLAAGHALAPRLPVLSDLDYPNYLRGWPVVEAVIAGSLFNALFRVTKPAWLPYAGGILAATSVLIWFLSGPKY